LTRENRFVIVNHMVNYSERQLNPVFSALSDPTRRAILTRLTRGEATVSQVAKPFGISLPAISKHIKILEEAGLLARRKRGRTHHLHLVAIPLKNAAHWLEQYHWFWESQFDSLESFLKDDSNEQPRRSR
jgi:DNA-binding transcriptional ArsR family regulator